MATLSAWLALSEGNPPVTSGFYEKGPEMRSFDVFSDDNPNKL